MMTEERLAEIEGHYGNRPWIEELIEETRRLRARIAEPKSPTKIWAIMGGGDWYDASVEYVSLQSDTDINALSAEYKEGGGFTKHGCCFANWLVKEKGCRLPTKDELEEVPDP